jgi:hypothetical protein
VLRAHVHLLLCVRVWILHHLHRHHLLLLLLLSGKRRLVRQRAVPGVTQSSDGCEWHGAVAGVPYDSDSVAQSSDVCGTEQ